MLQILSRETNLALQNTDLKSGRQAQAQKVVCKPGDSSESAPLFPRPLLIIVATAFGVILPFFLLGILAGHDFTFHVNSWMEVLSQWKQGIIYPRWAASANYGYGDPRFIFYPPASWTLGAALGIFLPWKAVPGVYVWFVLTLSGCSMFVLARQCLSRRIAVFAAALYAANPYYFVIIYWRSDFAELLAGALLPLLLLFVLRTREEGTKPVILLSLVIAAAWLTNAPVAVMANYSLILMMTVLSVIRRSPKILVAGTAAMVLGAALAAFYVVPAAYEQGWTNIDQVLAPGVRPQDNFLFTMIGNPGHDAFNRLLSIVSMAEAAILAAAIAFEGRWRSTQPEAFWALFSLGAAATLLMFPITNVFWTDLPKLRFLQFPWRWLLCSNVAFALLVTIAWQSRKVRAALCVAMLGILVFGAWHIQRPWKQTGKDISRMLQRQKDGLGYRGRPEYVPVGADFNNINDNDADKLTLEGNGRAQINVQQWSAESKTFSVNVTAPGKLVLRLFNYPAWRVEVNGRIARSETQPETGQMIVPVQPGENQVHISFGRTWDRILGGIISAIAGFALLSRAVLRTPYTRPSGSLT